MNIGITVYLQSNIARYAGVTNQRAVGSRHWQRRRRQVTGPQSMGRGLQELRMVSMRHQDVGRSQTQVYSRQRVHGHDVLRRRRRQPRRIRLEQGIDSEGSSRSLSGQDRHRANVWQLRRLRAQLRTQRRWIQTTGGHHRRWRCTSLSGQERTIETRQCR